jgi:predicted O-methyltransferase YrrM
VKASAAARAVMRELHRLRIRDDAWQIPRTEAEALHDLVLRRQCKLGVEIGTSYGYSALHFAAALRQTGGRLHTIDIRKKKCDAARQAFERAGLDDIITCHLGDARDVIPIIPGQFDFAFLDADKQQIHEYFDLIWPRLRIGGMMLTDNVATHPELVPFVDFLHRLPDAESGTLQIGNGVEVTYKKAAKPCRSPSR